MSGGLGVAFDRARIAINRSGGFNYLGCGLILRGGERGGV